MKKILLAAAVIIAALTSACSGESASVRDNEKSLKAKIENCTNSDSLAVYMDQARAYAQTLVNEGKTEEAKKYLDDLTPAIEKQSPTLKEQWNAAVATITKVTTNAADTVAAKAVDAKDAAVETANDVKDAAAEKYEAAKKATGETAEKVKEGAQKTVNEAVEGTQNALDKLKK